MTSIRCYVCDSSVDDECTDPFDSKSPKIQFLQECGHNAYGSYKESSTCLKYKYLDPITKELRISRKCYIQVHDPCKSSKILSDENVKFCETCENDGCNGASSLNFAVLGVFLPVIITFYIQNR